MLDKILKYKKPICLGLGLFVAGEIGFLGYNLSCAPSNASASIITSEDSSEKVQLEDLTDTGDSDDFYLGIDLGREIVDTSDKNVEKHNPLDLKLSGYSYDTGSTDDVAKYLMLKSVVENQDIIKEYSDTTGLPFSLVAAQLFSESTFNPYLRSGSDAYGLGQLKEIAFLESVYTLLSVPGGFNKKGETKVGSLLSKKVEKERYSKFNESVFGDNHDLENELVQRLDQIIDSEEFSFTGYCKRTQSRIESYDQLNSRYLEISHNGKKIEERKINILSRKSLIEEQEKDNILLRSTLVNYWHENVGQHQGKERFVQRDGKTVQLPGYELNPDNLSENYVSDLNFFTMLNMIREYRLAGDDFSVGSKDVKSALRKYGDGSKYVKNVMARYEIIDEFVGDLVN